VWRYVIPIMSTAMRLRCCQCCSLQKDYRLGISKNLWFMFIDLRFRGHARGQRQARHPKTNGHAARSSTVQRSTFNTHPPSHMLIVVIMVLLKQTSIVTTEHDRRPAKVCDFSFFHAHLPTLWYPKFDPTMILQEEMEMNANWVISRTQCG